MLDRSRKTPEVIDIGTQLHIAETAIYFGRVTLAEIYQTDAASEGINESAKQEVIVEVRQEIRAARVARTALRNQLELVKPAPEYRYSLA